VSGRIKTAPGEPPPAKVTMEELMALNKALNIDFAALKGSTDSGANVARGRLAQLKNEVAAALEKSPLSQEAKQAYADANKLHATQIADVFYTGQAANLRRFSSVNELMLKPENIVSKMLSSETDAVQLMKAFKDDPMALSVLRTGINNDFRQKVVTDGVVDANKAAKYLADHEFELNRIKEQGLDAITEIKSVANQAKQIAQKSESLVLQGKSRAQELTEQAKTKAQELKAQGKTEAQKLSEQGKTIPGIVESEFKAQQKALDTASKTLGFKYVKDLRAKVAADPQTRAMVLQRLDQPARESLSRGIVEDALSPVLTEKSGGGEAALKYLTQNEQNILEVLKATNPKTANQIFADAKQSASLYSEIEKVAGKVSDNALQSRQKINQLTMNLPEVRAAVAKVERDIANGVKFEDLAKEGARINPKYQIYPTEKQVEGASFFGTVWSMARAVYRQVKGEINDKLLAQIATEMANTQKLAAGLSKQTAKPTPTALKKVKDLTKKSAAQAARVYPISNAMAPQPESENALAP
jgi:hypothetical protein